MAQIAQQEAMESDDREGIILEYLETPLPTNWQNMTLYERRVYLGDKNFVLWKFGVSVSLERDKI